MNKSYNIKTNFDRKVLRSSDTNVFKFVFTKPNVAVEAVLYRYGSFRKRTVICCSTQCGCPVGCSFCGTGRGFVRSLYSDEIVDQIQQVMEIVEKDCPSSEIEKFQIMFMSMGEPFLNYAGLHLAIVALHNIYYPNAQLLVSTSAPKIMTDEVDFRTFTDLSQGISEIGIQFSVHESTDGARRKIIPTPTCSLEQIARLGEIWAARTSRKPFYNYCVHAGNSSDADVARLVSLFNPAVWETTLSVICETQKRKETRNDNEVHEG